MASRSITSPVISRSFANLLLAAIAPASITNHLIVAPKVVLLGTSAVALSPDTLKATLDAQEAAFSGYTTGGEAITLTAPGVVRAGVNQQVLAGNVSWVVTTADPLVTGTIYGAYLVDTTFGLIASGYFDSPVILGSVGDYVDLFWGVPMLLAA